MMQARGARLRKGEDVMVAAVDPMQEGDQIGTVRQPQSEIAGE
jgi:hypothetical protein